MYYPNVIYHVYNQSINFEQLFREERDYLLFQQKMKKHLLPVADLLCYCLMPTHFHFQLLPKPRACAQAGPEKKQQKIHAAFRIMLSSYTRIINDRYGRRGSLFRAKTKYKPAYTDFLPEDWEMKEDIPFTRYIPYVKVCFRYIHRNPVEAGLVDAPEQWPFSSAPAYAGLVDAGLVNLKLTQELIGIHPLSS